MPPFDESRRGDVPEVRRYRLLMADAATAFLRLEVAPGVRRRVTVAALPERPGVRQRWRLEPAAGRPAPGEVRLSFSGRLDRPALVMVTEVSPGTANAARTLLRADGDRLRVEAPALPARVVIRVHAGTAVMARWRMSRSRGSLARAELVLAWPPLSARLDVAIEAAFEVPETTTGARAARDVPVVAPVVRSPALTRGLHQVGRPGQTPKVLVAGADQAGELDRMAERTAAYVLGCTALRTAADCHVILTDHRILPLSWTRDAYWQALLLLAAEATGRLRPGRGAGVVADHLRWLWWRAERHDGRWRRSHHADGRIKDDRFQVDQQLYPLLELADFWRATGELPAPSEEQIGPTSADWGERIAAAWRAVELAATGPDGLLATEENPADDPAARPYLLSCQLLAWHTARRLEPVAAMLGLERLGLQEWAARWRKAVSEHFVVETAGGGPMWAYAIDAFGGLEPYQDANDLPTALAPLWGFCPADEPAWQGTMRFALSEANPGHVPGRFGGLGSRHTPGTWPLGDIQTWVAASLGGERARAVAAVSRLLRAATRDGLLPEAYDPRTGRLSSRQWFAWPSATLGALWLLDSGGWARQVQPTSAAPLSGSDGMVKPSGSSRR